MSSKQLSINQRWEMDAEIDRLPNTTTSKQLSINQRWEMDAEIDRLPVFTRITNFKSTLNHKAISFTPRNF